MGAWTKKPPYGAFLHALYSQLTLLQHLFIQLEHIKDPPKLLSLVPKYWLEDDGTMGFTEASQRRSK